MDKILVAEGMSKKQWSKPWPVLILMFIYTVLFSFASINRYSSFHCDIYDMGIMIQTIWNTAHGHFLFDSVNMGFPISRIWVAHWEFIYFPIALIYCIFPSVNTILILQSLAVSIGALPVYWIARDKFQNQAIGVIFAAGYLLYPALGNANLADVHGVVFSIPFLLFAFYYLQKLQYGLFGLFALLALSCREDVTLILFMFGLYAIFIQKKVKAGFIISLVSIVYFLLYLKILTIRHLLGLPPVVVPVAETSHWSHLGANSFFSLIVAILKHPFNTLHYLISLQNIKYLIKVFAPVGFVSIFSPTTILLALPTFAINLLSNWPAAKGIESQYIATIVPFVFISAIYGSKNILDFIRCHSAKISLKSTYFSQLNYIPPILILSLMVTAFTTKSTVFKAIGFTTTAHQGVIEKIIQKIPQNASLSADIYLGTHASTRLQLYAFPDHYQDADYVLYDFYSQIIRLSTLGGFNFPSKLPMNEFSYSLLQDNNYGLISYEDGVALFKKGADYKDGLDILTAAPDFFSQASFSNSAINNLELFGYNKVFRLVGADTVLHVTLFWKALAPLKETYRFLYFVNGRESVLPYTFSPVFGLFPTKEWSVGQIIRDEVFLNLPRNEQGKDYSISMRMEYQNKNTSPIELFTIHGD